MDKFSGLDDGSYPILDEEDLPEVEEYEVFLGFADGSEDPEAISIRVSKALEEYSLDEILEENELTNEDALSILYELNYIGLPEDISYNEDENEQYSEEVESLQTETD